MEFIKNIKAGKFSQYVWSISSVLLTALGCFLGAHFFGYRTVALVLLVNVSILAMLFDIFPVLTAALLSALIWNYFFIPPVLTFHINNADDLLMFLLYFFIASVNAVLTFKIRKQEEKVRDREEKEKTIKLYNTLLNSLSHELRTPISTIIGSIDALTENKDKISEKKQVELFNQITIASLRLNSHVENLLNMSRLEAGNLKLNLDWCDTSELINKVIHDINIPYSQRIIFDPDENLPLFRFDIALIEQVVNNLLTNAIHYTPENSVIEVKVKHEFENCKIEVTDNGLVHPNNELNRLFDKFYRGSDNKTGGLGIGLSIVKGFVEAHNGTVCVVNNAQGGLSFIVEFPAQQSFVNNLKNE